MPGLRSGSGPMSLKQKGRKDLTTGLSRKMMKTRPDAPQGPVCFSARGFPLTIGIKKTRRGIATQPELPLEQKGYGRVEESSGRQWVWGVSVCPKEPGVCQSG